MLSHLWRGRGVLSSCECQERNLWCRVAMSVSLVIEFTTITANKRNRFAGVAQAQVAQAQAAQAAQAAATPPAPNFLQMAAAAAAAAQAAQPQSAHQPL